MRTQNNVLVILREMRKKLGFVIWYLLNLGIASDFLKSKFATLVTVRWNSSRSKYERNTFRHAAAMPYQIYQGFRISLSPHIPTSQRQSKGRPWIFHILCDCRPSKKGSPHIGAGIPSEISYWTFCGKFTEGYFGPLPFSVLYGICIVLQCMVFLWSEISFSGNTIQIQQGVSGAPSPPLSDKAAIFCSKKPRFWAFTRLGQMSQWPLGLDE